MIILPILSAGLLLLAFPNAWLPLGLWPAAWIFWVPLAFSLDRSSWRTRLIYGGLFSLVFYGLLVSWFISYHRLGYLVFVLALSLQGIGFAVLFPCAFSGSWPRVLYWPALWVVSEGARVVLMKGFAWGLGMSQSFNLPVLQIARVWGGAGIAFLVVLVNAGLYESLVHPRARRRVLPILALLMAGTWAAGVLRLARADQGPWLRVAVVQPNEDSRQKGDAGQVGPMAGRLVRWTQDLPAGPVDVMLWPETAIPLDWREDPVLSARIRGLAARRGAPLLAGTALTPDDGGPAVNAVLRVDPDGSVTAVYAKRVLVPFSEYWPPGRGWSWLRRLAPGEAFSFRSGTAPGLVTLSGGDGPVTLGILLCSEDTLSWPARQYARQGAAALVVLLNDGWFASPSAAILHLQNAVLRAVETGRPVIRAANSGWSGVIDAYGRRLPGRSLPLNQPGAAIWPVPPPAGGPGPYDFFPAALFLFCGGFVIMNGLCWRRGKAGSAT